MEGINVNLLTSGDLLILIDHAFPVNDATCIDAALESC